MRLAVVAVLAVVLSFAQATSHMSSAAEIVSAADQVDEHTAEETETDDDIEVFEEEETDEEEDEEGDEEEETDIDEDSEISERKGGAACGKCNKKKCKKIKKKVMKRLKKKGGCTIPALDNIKTKVGHKRVVKNHKICFSATCTFKGWKNVVECKPGGICEMGNCHKLADCTVTNKTLGTYTCQCPKGFAGPGHHCADINECAKPDACAKGAICINTPGAFSCKCKPGYTGDGKTCTDIDECTAKPTVHKCDKTNAKCTNTPGSYTCKCNGGWCGDGVTCMEWNKNSVYCGGKTGKWTQSLMKNITGTNFFIQQAAEKQHRGVAMCEPEAQKLICCNGVEFIDGWCRFFFIPDTSKAQTAVDKAMDITIKTGC